METLVIFRMVIDTGLLVLIWMVQRIVYPSFLHTAQDRLLDWHRVYMGRLAMIVIPLMFSQVFIIGHQVYGDWQSHIISGMLMVAVWILTFAVFVPLHKKISAGDMTKDTREKLVKSNWFRTVIWTLIWLIGLVQFFM